MTRKSKNKSKSVPELSAGPPAFPPEYNRLLNAFHTALLHPDQLPTLDPQPYRFKDASELQSLASLRPAMNLATWSRAALAVKALSGAADPAVLFRLTPEAANLLTAIHPDSKPLINQLIELNGLLLPAIYQSDPLKVYLNALTSLSKTVLQDQPQQWRRWLFDLAHREIQIPWHRREPDYSPTDLERQLSNLLQALAAHITNQSAFPTWPNVAQELLAQDWQPRKLLTGPGHSESTPRKAIPLTRLLQFSPKLYQTAQALGFPPETFRFLTEDTPEEICQAVAAAGLPLSADCGSLSALTPPELKAKLNQELDFTASGPLNLWSQAGLQIREIDRTTLDGPLRHQFQGQQPAVLPNAVSPEPAPPDNLSEAEFQLLLRTAPPHPRKSDFTGRSPIADNWLPAAAWGCDTTPQALESYLNDQAENWQPPEGLKLCPRAAECPAYCAQLQRENLIAFPLTKDGRFASCSWHQFQEKHGAQPPELRAQAARELLSPPLQPAGRSRAQKRNSAPVTTNSAQPQGNCILI